VEWGKGILKQRHVNRRKKYRKVTHPVNFFYFQKKKGREPGGKNVTPFLLLEEKKRDATINKKMIFHRKTG